MGRRTGGFHRRGVSPAVLAGLIALTVAVFLPAGGHDFIIFDDDVHVTENPWVRQGLTGAGLRWAFTSLGYGANWHPLTWISHMLDVELFGLAPRGHHLTSVGLHAAAVALLFLALRLLTGALWRGALVAALFAIHPLRVESVAWVAERKDVLAACFWSLTLLLYAGYARTPGPARALGVLLSFTAGLLSKPTTVSLPFVLLLLDWWPLGRLGFAPLSPQRRAGEVTLLRAVAEKVPLFALSAAAMVATYAAQKSGGATFVLEPYPLGLRAGNALWSCLVYLRKMIWPSDLAIFYPHPGFSFPWWKGVAAAGILSALTAVALACRRRRPVLVVGWAWYLGTLVPVLGFIQVGAQGLADRYTYLPLIGIFLAAAWSFPGAARGAPEVRRASLAAAVAAVAVCALLAWVQVGHWQNSRTVFARALEVTENNWMAHNVVGISLMEEGRAAAAEEHFARAAAIRPIYWRALYNLGNSLLAQERLEAAAAAYRQALALNPWSAPTYNNLGATYLKLGDIEEARRNFQHALQIQPGFADARRNLGLIPAGRAPQPRRKPFQGSSIPAAPER
jgi:Flp pilus assembly protein TadD